LQLKINLTGIKTDLYSGKETIWELPSTKPDQGVSIVIIFQML